MAETTETKPRSRRCFTEPIQTRHRTELAQREQLIDRDAALRRNRCPITGRSLIGHRDNACQSNLRCRDPCRLQLHFDPDGNVTQRRTHGPSRPVSRRLCRSDRNLAADVQIDFLIVDSMQDRAGHLASLNHRTIDREANLCSCPKLGLAGICDRHIAIAGRDKSEVPRLIVGDGTNQKINRIAFVDHISEIAPLIDLPRCRESYRIAAHLNRAILHIGAQLVRDRDHFPLNWQHFLAGDIEIEAQTSCGLNHLSADEWPIDSLPRL